MCLGPRAGGGVWNEHQLEGGPCTKVESAEVIEKHIQGGKVVTEYTIAAQQ